MKSCPHCESTNLSDYIGIDGSFLCRDCAKREILGILHELDTEQIKLMRRRLEDGVRKYPRLRMDVLTFAVMEGFVELPSPVEI